MARLLAINHVPKAARFPRAAVSARLRLAERAWPGRLANQTVAVALVSEAESRRLNKTYRGRNKATNVLSFNGECKGELGDIIICHQVALREAKAGRQKIGERISYLFAHGLLHLLGFDHQTKGEAASFARAEKKLLTNKAK